MKTMGGPSFCFGVIVLAAGASKRMGRPKLLLPWEGTTIAGHLIGLWRRLGAAQVAVVWSPACQAVEVELERLGFDRHDRILNPAGESSMFDSVRCAAVWNGWQARLTHWAIVLGDQPHLSEAMLRRLCDFARRHPDHICQPRFEGHRRHPVFLPRQAFGKIEKARSNDLKAFLSEVGTEGAYLDCREEEWGLDIDSPEDYRRALSLKPSFGAPRAKVG